MFCDIELFEWLKSTAANMGWSPFRRPLIWQKSESEGMAPWGGSGPRITTEFIFFATKGQRGLNASPIDVFNVKRVSRSERIHAAEKPVELLKTLIQCSTLPNDLVLDPCCGSGSTLVAAKELKRQALGIELDLDYYNTAMANVFGGDLNENNSVR
jgi:site-specific DNA-methyltransferase (adenine-specific)